MNGVLVEKFSKYYVVISYRDDSGKRKQKWISTGLDVKGNKRKAEEFMKGAVRKFEDEFNYRNNPDSDILFADFLDDWLERSKPNLQKSSYGSYQMQVKVIGGYFRKKGIMLLDLKPIDIANYYKWLQSEGKSIQVCEHHHVNIRRALQTAVKADLIPNNPADKIDRPRSPKHIAKFYNSKQLKTLFEKTKESRFDYIYKITALYGLRRSEMMGLRWQSIDFENNVLTLNHTVVQTRIHGKSVIVKKDSMKNQSSLRSLPLLPIVKKILLEEKAKQEKNKEQFGSLYSKKDLEYVCVDELGVLIRPDTVSGHFKLILKKNKLPTINFHELRHSCASLLLECGVGMKDIQEWLGHSTYTTTADIYSHLNYTSKLNIAGVLSDVFGGEKLPQDNTQNRNIAKILEGLVSESEENSDKSGLLEKSEEEFLDEEDNDGFIYEVKKQKTNRKSDIEM